MWQTKLYPELLQVGTDAERKKLLRDARRWGRGERWSWRRLLMVFAIYAGIVALGAFLHRAWSTNVYVQQWADTVFAGFNGGFAVWALEWMWRRPVRDELRRELIARGIPVCLHCGYSLTGLSEPRCPECGQSFVQKDRSA